MKLFSEPQMLFNSKIISKKVVLHLSFTCFYAEDCQKDRYNNVLRRFFSFNDGLEKGRKHLVATNCLFSFYSHQRPTRQWEYVSNPFSILNFEKYCSLDRADHFKC